MKERLEKTLKIGIPVAGAVLGITLLELTGFPKNLQNYESAKMDLVKEYFGGVVAYLQNFVPYISRGAIDFATGVFSASLSSEAYKKSRGNK